MYDQVLSEDLVIRWVTDEARQGEHRWYGVVLISHLPIFVIRASVPDYETPRAFVMLDFLSPCCANYVGREPEGLLCDSCEAPVTRTLSPGLQLGGLRPDLQKASLEAYLDEWNWDPLEAEFYLPDLLDLPLGVRLPRGLSRLSPPLLAVQGEARKALLVGRGVQARTIAERADQV